MQIKTTAINKYGAVKKGYAIAEKKYIKPVIKETNIGLRAVTQGLMPPKKKKRTKNFVGDLRCQQELY